MRVALVYFGMPRSIAETYKSHEQYIKKPLDDANIPYDVIFHTWQTKKGYRVWDRPYKPSEHNDWNLLKANLYKCENQDAFTEKLTAGDFFYQHIWDTVGHGKQGEWLPYLVMNHICALESQRRAFEMLMSMNKSYDYIILLRPDALFREPLQLFQPTPGTIYVPDFSHNEGVNDRMAIGDIDSMRVYMNRILLAKEYRAKYGRIVSEKFLKDVLDFHDIAIKKISFSFELKRPA